MIQTKTPMMRQYESIKANHPDSILFFRLGDFYEMFNEDAKVASKVLEITLTTRNKNQENAIPLCGIPYHAADAYINKLVKKGFKVAICEQVENPKDAKGIVKRDVIRTVTPGTYLNTNGLDSKENNFIISICPSAGAFGFAVIDISTGEFNINEFRGHYAKDHLVNEILRTDPKELLVPEKYYNDGHFMNIIPKNYMHAVTSYNDSWFEYGNAYKNLTTHYEIITLDCFGCEDLKAAISASGAVMHYIKETQKSNATHINHLSVQNSNEHMKLDSHTIKSMELIRRDVSGTKDGSLFGLLDQTVTSMGGRKLKQWITMPLLQSSKINSRLETVEKLKDDIIKRKNIRTLLSNVYDLERIIGRLNMQLGGPRDLISLKDSIKAFNELELNLKDIDALYIKEMLINWDNLDDVFNIINDAIVDEPPVTLKDGGYIKEEFNDELFDIRKITKDARTLIFELEAREKERSGITSLKVRFNNVYGYYIEVTKKNVPLIPNDYIRKQSLTNCERFITQELKVLEEKILHAKDIMLTLEQKIFEEVRLKISKQTKRVQKMASTISKIDILTGFAECSSKFNFVKPEIDDSDILSIKDGRHPVIEFLNPDDPFIPNNTTLDCKNNQISLITGPNMAGKSTYLRQVAIIVLMAQTGCFVPAKAAKIGIVDRIFTRIGAHDDLVKGQSTFMVEMSETANILNNATKKSLIILDEIGRGTSTFDGISIAWSIAEYIAGSEKLGAKTLFATHYFELTELENKFPNIKNYNIAIKESNDEIIFLRKIERGSADKSYGIQVAKLAGLPKEVLKKAGLKLIELEKIENKTDNYDITNKNIHKVKESKALEKCEQLSLFSNNFDTVIDQIKNLRIEELTPIEALLKLNEIKGKLVN